MSRRSLLIANSSSKYAPTDTVFDVEATTEKLTHKMWVFGTTAIDWGDGVSETTSSPVTASPNVNNLLSHTYATDGTYTIKVSGTGYRLRHNAVSEPNLVTRIRHIGNNLYSAEGIFGRAGKLAQIDSGCKFVMVTTGNISNGFAYSGTSLSFPDGFVSGSNLTNFNSFGYGGGIVSFMSLLPNTAVNLTNFMGYTKLRQLPENFKIPAGTTNLDGAFDWLAAFFSYDISNMFPEEWATSSKTISVKGMFRNGVKIYGTAPANLLWLSGNTFSSTTNCFQGCTQLTNYNDIPASWGGGGA